MTATTTANNTVKATAHNPMLSKPAKLQRRMARSAPSGAELALPPTAALSIAEPALGSKIAAVIALLSREQGATSAELITATSWLPHTMRAALTGLRKQGRTIERSKRGTQTCYKITAALAQ